MTVEKKSKTELDKIEKLAGRGELFAAIDLAENYIAKYLHQNQSVPRNLRRLTVLLMARGGSIYEAFARYKTLELDKESDIDSRSLYARLLKDIAFASPPKDRKKALTKAGLTYQSIYDDTADSYPGINAATLAALVGNTKKARKIAREIIAMTPDTDQAGYWDHATLVEANLILGDFPKAQRYIESAAQHKGTSLSDKASTLKQLRKLLSAVDQPYSILKPLRPKPTLHYSGHMIAPPGKPGRVLAKNEDILRARIEAEIDRINPGAGFGALASGSDILIAEYLIKKGVDLHVVLPFAEDDFVNVSVTPAQGGEGGKNTWVDRFHKCMKKASTVTYLTTQSYMGDDILFDLGAKLAMGRVLLHARNIAGQSVQLAVWDKQPTNFPAGTAVDIKQWKQTGKPQYILDVSDLGATPKPAKNSNNSKPEKADTKPSPSVPTSNRSDVTMLFGDFKGFSKLKDTELLDFVNHTLTLVADVFGHKDAHTDFTNTWGDGLFAVWKTPVLAARCALALQKALTHTDGKHGSGPTHLPIRISLHYGVTHCLQDPVLNKKNYFGEAVSRAARIEPITPVGAIYATEAFAAMLMLNGKSGVSAEYVGTIKVAKDYGAFPLYRIYHKHSHT